jgi:hypothetical protein
MNLTIEWTNSQHRVQTYRTEASNVSCCAWQERGRDTAWFAGPWVAGVVTVLFYAMGC